MLGCRGFHLWISLWLKPSSKRTQNPQSEGSTSCCWWSSASTEACPPPLPLCLARPPRYDSTLVRLPTQHPLSCALFPSPEPGEGFLLSSPPPCPQHCRPGARLLHPAGPRGGFSESATVSAETLAVRANGRSFFNQLKWHFLLISLPLSATKKEPVRQQQGKKETPTQPPRPQRLQSHRTSSRGDYL